MSKPIYIHIDTHSIYKSLVAMGIKPNYERSKFLTPFIELNFDPKVTFYMGLLSQTGLARKKYGSSKRKFERTLELQNSFTSFLESQNYTLESTPFRGSNTISHVKLTMNAVHDILNGETVVIATNKPEYAAIFNTYDNANLILATIPDRCNTELLDTADNVFDLVTNEMFKGFMG